MHVFSCICIRSLRNMCFSIPHFSILLFWWEVITLVVLFAKRTSLAGNRHHWVSRPLQGQRSPSQMLKMKKMKKINRTFFVWLVGEINKALQIVQDNFECAKSLVIQNQWGKISISFFPISISGVPYFVQPGNKYDISFQAVPQKLTRHLEYDLQRATQPFLLRMRANFVKALQ